MLFVSFLEDFPRSLVLQRLVRPSSVVEREPLPNSFSGLTGRIVFIEIHFLPLEGSPEPFGEDIVDGSPFAVHTDPDVSGEEAFQIAVTGEMAPLVTVENRGERGFKGPVHTVEDKRHLQGLIQRPGDDIPGMPVDNGDKVHPSLKQADVRDVDPPDMMRVLGRDIPEQIRIDLVRKSPFAEVGTRMDPFDAHLPHGGPDPLPSHDEAFPGEDGRNAATPEERPAGVEFVDPVPKPDLFLRRRNRPIIQDRSRDPGQVGGNDEGKVGILGDKPAFALCLAQLIPDFFLSQVNWVVSWPIS